jgi:MerR family transcriptional regulator, light-induced transcriptional regulator
MSAIGDMAERRALAERLRFVRALIAHDVVVDLLAPDSPWQACFAGDSERWCRQETDWLLDSLMAALDTGSTASFLREVRWMRGMLASRGLPRTAVTSQLQLLASAIGRVMPPGVAGPAIGVLEACYDEPERSAIDRRIRPRREQDSEVAEELARLRERFLEAALDGRRADALAVIRDAMQGYEPMDVCLAIIQEGLREVGHLWETNRITIAEEHLVTYITQHVLFGLDAKPWERAVHGGRAVLCAAEGERHQIGIHLLSDGLESIGWSVRFVGGDVPPADVTAAVRRTGAHLLCISATLFANLPRVRQLIDRLRDGESRAITVMVGGGAFELDADLVNAVGADLTASDLRSAMALADELRPGREPPGPGAA